MKHFRRITVMALTLVVLLLLGPLGVLAGPDVSIKGDWTNASDEPMGTAPDPATTREAVVQVYGARAFRWRGAFGIHTWVAVKAENAPRFTTYEVVGWNVRHGDSALEIEHGPPDRRWYGAAAKLLGELRGKAAQAAIPKILRAAAAYPFKHSYSVWPGPNSNTFTAFVTRQVPELNADLPPTAIGKDYPVNGEIFTSPPSGRGLQISLMGLFGVLVSPVEGLEVNLLGLSFGIDPGDLALRLPGIGKLGP